MKQMHAHLPHHHLGSGDAANNSLKANYFKLAISATLHCLLGCGLGEISGMIIGAALHMDNLSQMILAIILGIVGGFVLGMRPLLKAKFSFRAAFRMVLIAEGLSILVMETTEVLVQVYTPGVMHATLTDGIFWIGMLLALAAGFLAAFPINYYMVRKGRTHHH
ncbi:DUF4396 domain-containing protein [Segetibacter sp. 3557_3]|uniref:DUF4396 domain-containing protein n=1 Tax=Segetibacter sp. 3557_3 TaxID=2547429 RepID=UPI0010588E9A|nr:DUF4396 domain-containing protein [Segetibacter sp. 3557_3]TDH21335.1 DUF4396 domain-containing protein [Segetibacter sp. 3557_3]